MQYEKRGINLEIFLPLSVTSVHDYMGKDLKCMSLSFQRYNNTAPSKSF